MKTWIRTTLFALAGGLLGLTYYHFFGCTTGCPITSSPWMTMGYFAVIGILLSPLTVWKGRGETQK